LPYQDFRQSSKLRQHIEKFAIVSSTGCKAASDTRASLGERARQVRAGLVGLFLSARGLPILMGEMSVDQHFLTAGAPWVVKRVTENLQQRGDRAPSFELEK
jgi:hypothetical protein